MSNAQVPLHARRHVHAALALKTRMTVLAEANTAAYLILDCRKAAAHLALYHRSFRNKPSAYFAKALRAKTFSMTEPTRRTPSMPLEEVQVAGYAPNDMVLSYSNCTMKCYHKHLP